MRLQGKHALVTAAAQGIGRATALAFVHEGARVIAADINAHALETLQAEAGDALTPLRLDVTDSAAIAAFAALHQDAGEAFDVLVNCAGVVHGGSILEASDEDWEFAWRLNVGSMFQLIRALLPGMLAHGGGSIVNVSSVASSIKGVPNRFVYSTTKAAVIGRRLHHQGHPLQRDLPGHRGIPVARCAHRRAGARAGSDLRRGARGLRRAPADGAAGPPRGDRRAGGVPGQRRIRLHHRHHAGDRRRLGKLKQELVDRN